MRTRTTLSLDPDVAAMIEREISKSNLPFERVVNQKLRMGFAADAPQRNNLDDIGEVLDLFLDDRP